MHIETHIRIKAKASEVWKELVDFDRYPEWSPFVKSLKGTVQEGHTIQIKLPGMTFTPTVCAFQQNQELRWLGKLWLSGLFDGEHYFRLKPHPDGSTTFIHGEYFSGVLVPLFKNQLLGSTKKGFEAMNAALKSRVESKKNV